MEVHDLNLNMVYLGSFLIAFLISLISIPAVRRISLRLGRVAQPRADRWHRKPTAVLGGIGLLAAFSAGIAASLFTRGGLESARWGILIGSGCFFLLGLYDDYRPMTPQAKLVGQILIATLVIAFGYSSEFFTPRIANELVARILNFSLTLFWLVGITNAINLLDNMDGLAGGIALITAGILSYFFWRSGDQGSLVISLSLAGGLLGFLIFNFPPASIFMGNSGSLFLGFTLAVLAIAREPQASNVFAVMGVPTVLFLLPILDTTLVTITRLLRGQSPIKGGLDHTSHRLIAIGLSERQTLVALYSVALISGVFAATIESIQYWFSLVLVPALVLLLALLFAYLGGLQVLDGRPPPIKDKPFTRILLDLTFKRHLLEIILDFFLIGIAYYLAFFFHYGLSMDDKSLTYYLQTLPVALIASYLSFYIFGVYRGVWRYVDLGDLMRYMLSSLGGLLLSGAGAYLIFTLNPSQRDQFETIPLSIFILFAVFIFLGLAGTRVSFRIFNLLAPQRLNPDEQRVLIYGAGDAGELAVRWMITNPSMHYRPVGFLDDDPFMRGRQIHGVEVLGDLEILDEAHVKWGVEGIILAIDDPSEALVEQITAKCDQKDFWVRRLRLEFEPIELRKD